MGDGYDWDEGDFDDVGMLDEESVHHVEIRFDEIRAETALAWLLVIDGDEEWIPKSQAENVEIEKTRFGRRHGRLEIPQWLAEEKGLCS